MEERPGGGTAVLYRHGAGRTLPVARLLAGVAAGLWPHTPPLAGRLGRVLPALQSQLVSAGQLLLHQLVALLANLRALLLAAVRVALLGAAHLHLSALTQALHLHTINTPGTRCSPALECSAARLQGIANCRDFFFTTNHFSSSSQSDIRVPGVELATIHNCFVEIYNRNRKDIEDA